VPAESVVSRYHLMPFPTTECWTVYDAVRFPNPPGVGAADAPLAVGVTLLVGVPVVVTLEVGEFDDVTEDDAVFDDVGDAVEVATGVVVELADAVADADALEVAVCVGEPVREADQDGEGDTAVP
jgi:hypothetical protein